MQRKVPPERLEGLWSDDIGLDDLAVVERRARFGLNAILVESSAGWVAILRSTVQDPMIWFLIGTATLFLWLGDYTEAAVLAAALIPIAGMDAYLHRRTEASTEGLKARLASQARVIRDGSEQDIPATELVPGDLAIVPAGAWFPADGLILSGSALQADESTLTGEALPVRKAPIAEPPSQCDREDVLAIAATASRTETSDPLDQILLDTAAAWEGEVEAVFPFTEDRLRETCVRRGSAGIWRIAMKGAPETVLHLSDLSQADHDD